MTGKTHRVGGVVGGLVGFAVLKNNGLLVEEISEPLQMILIHASSMYGSILLDMDHDWDSCPSKDIFSWVIWKILHLTTPIRRWLQGGKFRRKIYKRVRGLLEFTDSKHRSWQTHSDLTLILILGIMIYLPRLMSSSYDGILITVLGEGILFGVLSHLLLDMLTTDGIWSFILAPLRILSNEKKDGVKDYLFRLHLVPDIKFFSTSDSDSPWERLIRGVMYIFIALICVYILYLWSPYIVSFRL